MPTVHELIAGAASPTAWREWTARALRSSGALRSGDVTHVELTPFNSDNSRAFRIALDYGADATGSLPRQLFLKTCGHEQGAQFGASEVHYYTHDYRDADAVPIPHCFDAAFEPDTRRYHLLLEDLSDTHQSCMEGAWGGVPRGRATPEHARALASSIATLHAARWGEEGLARIGLTPPSDRELGTYHAYVARGVEPLIALVGSFVTPAWATRLRALFQPFPTHCAARVRAGAGLTLIHGDLNPGNILAPRSGDGSVYLIDRQPFDWSLTRWLGALDLVTCVVPWWDVETRRALEPAVLEQYHATLVERGVRNYTFDQLSEDYRFAIIEALRVPISWCIPGEDSQAMRWLWQPQLERAMTAYQDLQCDALWQ